MKDSISVSGVSEENASYSVSQIIFQSLYNVKPREKHMVDAVIVCNFELMMVFIIGYIDKDECKFARKTGRNK